MMLSARIGIVLGVAVGMALVGWLGWWAFE